MRHILCAIAGISFVCTASYLIGFDFNERGVAAYLTFSLSAVAGLGGYGFSKIS